MNAFYHNCFDKINDDKCINDFLKDDKSKINKCMNDSFVDINDKYVKDNTLLADAKNNFLDKNVPYYPAVFVNDRLVKGEIDKLNIFDEICGSFIEPKQ